jgi:hypothetical protein
MGVPTCCLGRWRGRGATPHTRERRGELCRPRWWIHRERERVGEGSARGREWEREPQSHAVRERGAPTLRWRGGGLICWGGE